MVGDHANTHQPSTTTLPQAKTRPPTNTTKPPGSNHHVPPPCVSLCLLQTPPALPTLVATKHSTTPSLSSHPPTMFNNPRYCSPSLSPSQNQYPIFPLHLR